MKAAKPAKEAIDLPPVLVFMRQLANVGIIGMTPNYDVTYLIKNVMILLISRCKIMTRVII